MTLTVQSKVPTGESLGESSGGSLGQSIGATVGESVMAENQHHKPAVTVYSVAALAGVSHATVSRVLNGRPSIAAGTRKKVLDAAHKLGYRPNRSARALVSRRGAESSLSVEVVLCRLTHTHQDLPGGYYMQIVRGCDTATRAEGDVDWKLSYWMAPDDPQDLPERAWRQKSGGALLLGSATAELVGRLRDAGAAVVLVDQDLPDVSVDVTVSDNFGGGLMAGRYLLQRGYRRIGWLGGPVTISDWSERLLGLRAALAEEGLLMGPADCRSPIGTNNYGADLETYEHTVRQWLSESDRPEALVLPCAMQASVVQRVMMEKGLKCPDDLAMICFDNDVFISLCPTEPTRIDTRPQVVGMKAMERLIQIVRQPGHSAVVPHRTVIPVQLIEGKSVGRR